MSVGRKIKVASACVVVSNRGSLPIQSSIDDPTRPPQQPTFPQPEGPITAVQVPLRVMPLMPLRILRVLRWNLDMYVAVRLSSWKQISTPSVCSTADCVRVGLSIFTRGSAASMSMAPNATMRASEPVDAPLVSSPPPRSSSPVLSSSSAATGVTGGISIATASPSLRGLTRRRVGLVAILCVHVGGGGGSGVMPIEEGAGTTSFPMELGHFRSCDHEDAMPQGQGLCRPPARGAYDTESIDFGLDQPEGLNAVQSLQR